LLDTFDIFRKSNRMNDSFRYIYDQILIQIIIVLIKTYKIRVMTNDVDFFSRDLSMCKI
jgi:hypothetical protein